MISVEGDYEMNEIRDEKWKIKVDDVMQMDLQLFLGYRFSEWINLYCALRARYNEADVTKITTHINLGR